jgi:hypothetical protein
MHEEFLILSPYSEVACKIHCIFKDNYRMQYIEKCDTHEEFLILLPYSEVECNIYCIFNDNFRMLYIEKCESKYFHSKIEKKILVLDCLEPAILGATETKTEV